MSAQKESTQQGPEEPVPSPTTDQSKCHPSRIPYQVVIVIAAFFMYTIYAGTMNISGLYLKYFLDKFEAGKVTTTGVISVQGSLSYFSGIMVGPLIVRFGTQKVAVAGSLLASVGIFLSGFAFNIVLLYIFYGAFTGFGLGTLLIVTGVSVQEHTNKRRALAGTIALCGAGFGTLIMPQIAEYAIIEYGERGSLLILGGIVLNTLPCALLLRSQITMDIEKANMIQLKFLARQRRESLNPLLKHRDSICDLSNDSENGVINPAYKEEAEESVPATTTLDKTPSKEIATFIGNEASFQTGSHVLEAKPKADSLSSIPEAEIVNSSEVNMVPGENSNGQLKSANTVDNHSSSPHVHVYGPAAYFSATGHGQNTILECEEIIKSSVVIPAEEPNDDLEVDKNVDNHSSTGVIIQTSSEAKMTDKKASAIGKVESTSSPDKTLIEAMGVNGRPTHGGQQARPRTAGLSPIFELNSRNPNPHSTVDEGLSLSVVKLANIIVNTTAISDDSSNTLTNPRLHQRRTSIKEVMTPVSLDTGSVEFTAVMAIIISAHFFWIGGFFSAYVFTPIKAISIGLGASEGAALISLAGIGDVGGRVVATLLSPCHDKLPTIICIVSVVFTGISCAFIGICRTYTEMMIALIIYGISSGISSAASTTMIRDVIGISHFALILGYAFSMGGIGNLFCMQLVSFIWEKTSDISIPFSISGGLIATAALLVMAAFIRSLHTHKNLKKM